MSQSEKSVTNHSQAHSLASLNKKNGISVTPLNSLLKALTFALNNSAPALVCLLTKKILYGVIVIHKIVNIVK